MSALLLTSNNLHTAKAALQLAWSDIKSSHITEALAAAFGYRSHAALLADFKRSVYPPLARANPEALSERLAALGYPGRDACLVVKIVRNGLPDAIWIECKNQDVSTANNWHAQCKARNIPRVWIKTRQKDCLLDWDSITMDDSALNPKIPSPDTNEMFDLFQARARQIPDNGKADFFGSGFVGSIDGLLIETARELADDFFEMLYGPLRRVNLF